MFKKIINGLIDHPILTSIFAADFFILLFHRPPFLFSLAMLGGLIAMCMYFGQKLTLFKNWLAPQTNGKPAEPGSQPSPAPGLLRRLAACVYDLFLLVALWFVATAMLLPLNSGEAFTTGHFFYPLYLLIISFVFYGWFWTHGGQTLGLKAWQIKVLTLDRKPINWTQAFIRFVTALLSWGCFGLGFLWIFIDKKRMGWHDRLSKTAVFFDAQKK